jgi:predicted acyltransferase
VLGLLGAGAACLAAGWIWGLWYPINKHLCTSSFVLWAGGWCFLLLAVFYGVIDVLGWRAWAFPFVVIGANALLAYVVSHLFGNQIARISGVLFAGLARHLERFGWQSFVFATGSVLVLWLILWSLYRKRIFWRV